jgi:hypothetical protein
MIPDMKYKGTIIGLAVLLVLGGYVYFFERQPLERDASGEIKIALIKDFKTEEITQFKIMGKETTQGILGTRNQDSSWNLLAPVKDKGDAVEIEGFLSTFKDLKPERTLKDNLLAKSTYGLDTPQLQVELTGKSQYRFMVGNVSPGSNTFYVQQDNSPVIYLMNRTQVGGWFKSPDSYRDKMITDITPATITQISIRNAKTNYAFKKTNDQWNTMSSPSIDLDKYKVEDILWKISNARILNFYPRSSETLSQSGLSNPMIQIRCSDKNGKVFELSISNQGAQPGEIFASSTYKESLFSIDTGILPYVIIPNIELLRNRTLFDFKVDAVQTISWSKPTTMSFRKNKEEWFYGSQKVDFAGIEDILYALNGIQFTQVIEENPKNLEKYGLAQPKLQISWKTSQNKDYVLSIGDALKNPNYRYVLTNQNHRVVSLETVLIEKLVPELKSLLKSDKK